MILLGLCMSETKFYYPEYYISKYSLDSNQLTQLLIINGLIGQKNDIQNFDNIKVEKIDKFGNTHYIYQQFYNNIPVFGRYLRIHFGLDDRLSSLSSNIYFNLKINNESIIFFSSQVTPSLVKEIEDLSISNSQSIMQISGRTNLIVQNK